MRTFLPIEVRNVSDSNCICSGVSACRGSNVRAHFAALACEPAREAFIMSVRANNAGSWRSALTKLAVSPEMLPSRGLHPAPWPDSRRYTGLSTSGAKSALLSSMACNNARSRSTCSS